MNNIRKIVNILLVLFIAIFYFSCFTANKEHREMDKDESQYSYLVKKVEEAHFISSEWNDYFWRGIDAIGIENFMGEKPDHFPSTKVKLRYDKDHIYVIFSVDDQYIKAVAKETHGRVWEDSCVEFFFSPGPDVERGYFNLEANCKGVFLLQYHLNDREINEFVDLDDCAQIEIAHSLTRNVEQESADPEVWTLEYKLPISILSKYMKVETPGPGVSWRANFYKCADKTSHPHWLTWAPVDFPRPNFHLPEFFGRLEFE